LKVDRELDDQTSGSRVFQTRAATIGKAQSLTELTISASSLQQCQPACLQIYRKVKVVQVIIQPTTLSLAGKSLWKD